MPEAFGNLQSKSGAFSHRESFICFALGEAGDALVYEGAVPYGLCPIYLSVADTTHPPTPLVPLPSQGKATKIVTFFNRRIGISIF